VELIKWNFQIEPPIIFTLASIGLYSSYGYLKLQIERAGKLGNVPYIDIVIATNPYIKLQLLISAFIVIAIIGYILLLIGFVKVSKIVLFLSIVALIVQYIRIPTILELNLLALIIPLPIIVFNSMRLTS